MNLALVVAVLCDKGLKFVAFLAALPTLRVRYVRTLSHDASSPNVSLYSLLGMKGVSANAVKLDH